MNEIDPSNSNGSLLADHQQEATSSSNKSPLLSSLLTSARHDSISNGQQSTHNKNDHGIMLTPKLVTNSQYDEENAFMTKKPFTQNTEASANELDLNSASANNHRKFSNLNEILHRNNNNKVNVTSEPSAKSILENCLLNPSPQKNPTRIESHTKMDDSEFHHHLGSPSTSSMMKYSEDSRRVEPLKINLNREPIRTVIKLPQSHPPDSSIRVGSRTQHSSSTDRNSTATISPTLSSSSSLSSESSFENCPENANNQRPSSIQVIPKLHIRNLLDGSLNHEQSELHIVPKLTITGLNSPQSTHSNSEHQTKEHVANSITESSPAIPKLTIKKDNNSDYHLNDSNSIPKLHIKSNHVHQVKDGGVKLSFKSVSEPHVPKLTIKTKTDNDEMMIISNDETLKSNKISTKTSTPSKNSIKSAAQEESIPKITLKAVNNNAAVQTFEKIVPKIVVKVPKEPTEIESSSCSSTPSPPHVTKLSIKPILPPEKEVPIQEKNCVGQTTSPQSADVKFSINRLIGTAEMLPVENDDCKPLEINTSSVIKNTDSGQDSPRIILKINKTNSESITTEIVPHSVTDESSPKAPAPNKKRVHSNDNGEEFAKKSKLCEEDEDVILINDSDASSNETVNKNNHKAVDKNEPAKEQTLETKTNSVSRSLRLSRRNHNTPAPETETVKSVKEDSQSRDVDPLALSNDATVNSVDELVTPKRGRGRPKKIVEKVQPTIVVEEESTDPLETQVQEVQDSINEEGTESKKVSSRGRGRGRGRSKRTVEFIKNGKPVQITLEGHDDDDSPSFSLYNRSLRGGFNSGRKGRGSGKGSMRGKLSKHSPFVTPERSKEAAFTQPTDQPNNRRKLFNTPSLFEEDTRMSIGCDSQQQTPLRPSETPSCEESQSSLLSNTSNTVEGSIKKRQKKMEVCEPEGRMEFTIELLAEYDWPQNEPGRNRDTFMIQEQIAEYLGVKSFKRKYPDLVRRPVEMEERNYLFENGLATEKMCDLGLTAVYASEVLDIMCNDYPEKYEEYKRYQREKAFRFARMRLETAAVDRSQMQKDKAITSASEFNTRFNKDRRENRRSCMDLQNFLIQKPTPIRDYNLTPAATHKSHYPVALVPGQFSEYYEKYTPLQLACYPLNTVLVDHKKLEEYLRAHPDDNDTSEDDSSESDDEETSSDSDQSDSESSSDEECNEQKCKVCSKTPITNKFGKPEKLITCSTCKNRAHPSCIEMSDRMYLRTLAYKWQCSNCKTCNKCRKAKDNKMLYCVQCDRGFHIYCLGLRNVPEGQYHCDNCNVCSACGAKTPEGHFNGSLTQQQRQDLAMIARWNHEFVINSLTNIREHTASLCLPCFRKEKNLMTVE